MKNNLELAIVGAGIAGVAAAVYAKRSGLDFCLFEARGLGGQLLLMENIDNYIGLSLGTKGRDLAQSLKKTLADLEIKPINDEITKLEGEKKSLNLSTKGETYSAQSLIVATGANFRKLGVVGEEEFSGKGVSYCAVCDGFFFKGKTVAVVGGGNTAVEEALYLSDIAEKVFLIHRRDSLRAIDYLQKQLFAKDNIEIVFNSQIKRVVGSEVVKEVILENPKNLKQESLPIQGLFVAIGIEPNTKLLKGLATLDQEGFILTDSEMKAKNSLIWAAGDCRKRPLRQLITAASEGAIAAMSVYKYLKGHYISA